MTTEIEDQLRAGMAERSAGLSLTADVLGAARRGHARRAARRGAAAAAAVLGVAGLAVVVVTKSGAPPGGQPPVAGSKPAVAAQSPELSLAAAAAASDHVSYRFTIARELEREDTGLTRQIGAMEGAFDPAAITGYLSNPDTRWEHRLIAGVLYVRGGTDPSGPFTRVDGTFESLPIRGMLQESGISTADPQELVASLRQRNATIIQSSAGAYHYSVAKPLRGWPPFVFEGDIILDAGGRIAKVTCHTIVPADGFNNIFHTTIELSGYGLPVQVVVPAAIVSH